VKRALTFWGSVVGLSVVAGFLAAMAGDAACTPSAVQGDSGWQPAHLPAGFDAGTGALR
jgi:hypothetical protein